MRLSQQIKLAGVAKKAKKQELPKKVFTSVFDEFNPLVHQREFIEDYKSRNCALVAGFGCVAGETLINGVRVDALTQVDSIEVKTLFGQALATPAFCKGKADLYEVTTAGGKSIRVTNSHKFLTPGGWKELQDLTVGDLIGTIHGWSSIKSVEFVRHDYFYDLHVPFFEHYEAHGIYHHNSGKTKALLWKLIDLAHRNAGYAGGLYAPTAELARDVLIPELDEILEQSGIKYDYWSAPNPRYKLHFKEGSTTILVRSMENWKRIVGNNFAFACVDEIDTIKADVAAIAWKKIMGRMRAGNVRQIATTSTPEGFKFLYKWFVKEAKPGRKLIQAKTTDNPYLPDDFVQDLRDNYDPQLIEAYMNGQFVNLTSGTVYSNFDRKLNDCKDKIEGKETLHIGMDFNVNHMAAVINVIREGVPRAAEEIVDLEDTPAMIRAIQQRYEGHSIIIYPDASGGNKSSKSATQSDLSLLKQAGFRIKVDSRNPLVKDRVSTVQCALLNANNERRYLINTSACPVLTESLEQQVWGATGEPDKTQGLDHILDAAGYCVMHLIPIKKPVTYTTQSEAIW